MQIGGGIFTKGSFFFRSSLSIEKDNVIYVYNSNVKKSRITQKGINNKIFIGAYDKKCKSLFSGSILIEGNNNEIKVGAHTTLYHIAIVVRGNKCKVVIGDSTTCNGATLVCMGQGNKIELGEGCLLADNIGIWATDSHPIYDANDNLINPSKPVLIGDGVWIGQASKILKGVRIGDGAIIGMNTIVTKDIPPFTLNVGSPCKVIKENIHWVRKFIEK